VFSFPFLSFFILDQPSITGGQFHSVATTLHKVESSSNNQRGDQHATTKSSSSIGTTNTVGSNQLEFTPNVTNHLFQRAFFL
jgi:hypothetical protein